MFGVDVKGGGEDRILSRDERNAAMKSINCLLGTLVISMFAGCASTPVTLAPVGPNPLGQSTPSRGALQVFSSLAEQNDDQSQGGDGSPVWYQHTPYKIYNLEGKLVKRVGNTIGHYEEAPERVALPAGRYLVVAQATDYFWVSVPVVIDRGRTTRVHLDDSWKLPSETPQTSVVSLPDGIPVGWRAGSASQFGMN
jgi:hypothetical protein